MVDFALLESAFLLAMGAWLMVLGGAFLLSQRAVDRASAVLLVLAGTYAILWQQPALLGVGEAFHVALAQPVFLSLLSGAIFLWTYWLFEQHVDRLEEAFDTIEASLALEQTLVDVLSHDLRNPIAEAKLDIQQLARQAPEIDDRLSSVEDNLSRATEVMENGVLYSRLASRKEAMHRERIDLTDVVRSSVAASHDRAEAKDIHFDVEAPETLYADVNPLIEQAVGNLLDNAVKFSPEGSTVAVELTATADTVRFAVSDEGPGIPPAKRERLLQRFETDPGDGQGSGLGLGLAIARRLVHLHGGELVLGGSEAGGARVVLSLPRTPMGTNPSSPPPSMERHPAGGWPT